MCPEQAIYDITKLVYQPKIKKELGDAHKGWKQMAPDTKRYEPLGSPMHPGAKMYYQESGRLGGS